MRPIGWFGALTTLVTLLVAVAARHQSRVRWVGAVLTDVTFLATVATDTLRCAWAVTAEVAHLVAHVALDAFRRSRIGAVVGLMAWLLAATAQV